MSHPQFSAGDELRDLTPRISEYADRLRGDRESATIADRPQREAGRTQSDTRMHIESVSSAVWAGEQPLFDDYVAWNKVLYTNRGQRLGQLADELADVRAAIVHIATPDTAAAATSVMDAAIAQLEVYPAQVETFMVPGRPFGSLGFAYLKAVLAGDKRVASQIVHEAIEGGVPLADIYSYFFEATQQELGRMWQSNVINVAQEHLATEVTHTVMAQLYPYVNTMEKGPYTVVTAAVESELHGLGAQIVADAFEMNHWESFFLGANTPLVPILATVVQVEADVLALSVTMTSHLPEVAEAISALRANPETSHVRAMVGGYPFNIAPELWRTVGADGYAPNAREAVVVAEHLMSARSKP